MTASLRQRLIEQIRLDGPLNLADYVTACLHDPYDGYYSKHVRIGADGDFITAPSVSQMFGEMLGLWVAQMWANLGAKPIRLVEIGGGDGTLMQDMQRVFSKVPGIDIDTVMVEPSETLRQVQQAKLPGVTFCASIDALPEDRPLIIIANEVLDCLPARQFVRIDEQVFERRVGVDKDDRLIFGLSPADLPLPDTIADGEIIEISAAQQTFAADLAIKLKAATGAALLIDYGRDTPGTGDTLQALHRHTKVDPLSDPGQYDLTQWADLPSVARAVRQQGVSTSVITPQASFLSALGIETRYTALIQSNPDRAPTLQRQYERLMAADQMGQLFKVLGICYPVDTPLHALPPSS